MSSPYDVPEMTVEEVARQRREGEPLILLDVREPYELQLAGLGAEVTSVPLSKLARQREDALPAPVQDRDAKIVVFCHHGFRSAQVVAWLRQLGWSDVWNMAGGIDAYARDVDPAVGS